MVDTCRYEWRYERCNSKLGYEIYVHRLQTVSVNVNDAHRCKMNGCTGETAGIAWVPDGVFITGNGSYLIKIQQIQKKKNSGENVMMSFPPPFPKFRTHPSSRLCMSSLCTSHL